MKRLNFKKQYLSITMFSMMLVGYGQQTSTGYTAFGTNPAKVPMSLLDSLKNEADALARFRLIDTISKIHLQYGYTDSIISYGQMLQREVEFNKDEFVNKPYWLAKSYYIIGVGKHLNGLPDPALGYHIRALQLNIDDESLVYENQLGMARAYYSKKEYEKALPLFLSIIKESEDLSTVSTAELYASLLYRSKGENQESERLLSSALTKAKQAGNDKLEMIIELSGIQMTQNVKYNDTLFNQLETIKNRALAAHYYDLYTEVIIEISKMYVANGNADVANMTLSIAYTNAIQWDRWQLQKRILQALSRFYKTQEDYENAYAVMTQYTALNEQIIKNQNYNAVKELEIKHEIDKIEQETDRQRLIKNSILIGFLVLLGPVIALLVTYYQKLKTQIALNESQEEVNQQRVTSLIKDQELKLIKASVEGEDKERKRIAQELHDSIGGNLASIKLQLRSNETRTSAYKNIAKQLDDTYEQVRNLSHNLTAKKFEQNAFTQLVSDYIENINSGTDVSISFNPHPKEKVNGIKQHIQVEIFKVIQELLTNALKHAKAANIEIHANIYDQKLTLLFEDDGLGFDLAKVTFGMGLKGMKNRIETIGGTMIIDAMPNRGTVVNIDIPYKIKI
ncbi:ATP-binding protein [Spongiivirga sp. MCCC 1A20706]|uniref:tetratricopeptide repeat-containing sensor histidine kinase n=1 Tax=Spongiivirga sp. MCCC 1A20706 TaxID=3160963 RepID=UPI0039773752